MAPDLPDVVVRVAGADDIGTIASLRSLWSPDEGQEPSFDRRVAAWLADEGDTGSFRLALAPSDRDCDIGV